jgi:mRNA interferase RelE/StbE
MWTIRYKKSVKKDLKKISAEVRTIIRQAIEEKLMTDPLKFGTPLRRNLKGLMKLRVGNYRIIYSIIEKQILVEVIKIGHRKEVYRI